MDTVRYQIEDKLPSALVPNLMIIGTVSVIRHILALGARLALQPGSVKFIDLEELGFSGALLAVLILGLVVLPTKEPERFSRSRILRGRNR